MIELCFFILDYIYSLIKKYIGVYQIFFFKSLITFNVNICKVV